jgi:ATP-binding cassette subfamily F protein uup
MNYLSVENISKSYGERTLLKTSLLGLDQKIAFIAKTAPEKLP